MSEFFQLLAGLLFLGFLIAIVWLPAWWLAGRVDPDRSSSLIRLPFSAGLALTGYITGINLLGKLLDNSIHAVFVTVGLNLLVCVFLLYKKRAELGIAHLWAVRQLLLTVLLVAIVLSLPQWYQAVSGNRWDEVASSSIHLTAPNQFAEGMFPPRHNAFPDISIKYHYGFAILSGTVHWVTGISSNVSIDIVSTGLWLFTFLFTVFWLLQIGITKIAAIWGGFAVLLGGGLSWLYLPWLQIYKGFQKVPSQSLLTHSYDIESSWVSNLLTVMRSQNIYLRNADGDIFPLPFDIAISYQQHAVALGLALTLVAAYVFWLWQSKKEVAPRLLILSIFCFGLIFLGHAVFGAMASISAALVLLMLWLRRPSKVRFVQGAVFTLGVTILAFGHGGMMSTGPEYGAGTLLKLRDG
ncbi:MAG: hypothetical protein KJO08_09550, partial [Gammaproteobacteria bacterium]|nr:hypothetical protein [Gammaproteobacteria bacterium]NNJ83793.1 hypothetical protein [Gammaproteobacteria bacterium]